MIKVAPSTFSAAALIGAAFLFFGGCATDETTATGQRRESTIPWNRPASWEGPGVYGSSINGG